MRWLKRLFFAVAVLLVVTIVLAAIAYRRYQAVPAWYRQRTTSDVQRRLAAGRALQIAQEAIGWSANAQAEAATRHRPGGPSTFVSPKTIVFTEEEIMSFLEKADFNGKKELAAKINRIVSDPRLVLLDGAIVLTGKWHDSDTVISFIFKPSIDDQGRLHVPLTDVVAGTLSLPRSLLGDQLAPLEQYLRGNIGPWQRGAQIYSDGVVNGDEMDAAAAQLLLDSLDDEPSDGVVFLPLTILHVTPALAVKMTEVKISEGQLQVTLRPLTDAEHAALAEETQAKANQAVADQDR